MIRIQIRRDDGHVTKLEGESGMATCMGPVDQEFRKSDPPVVSIRCSNVVELAWNLAALMGAVRHHAPEAFEIAQELMPLCNFAAPVLQNRLPPEGHP